MNVPPKTVQSDSEELYMGDPLSNDAASKKRSSLACVRCRRRHIKCPGGEPCKKCIGANVPCEYVEADKKIVVSMRYLQKLHDDIARLKKENANLRNNVKETETKIHNITQDSNSDVLDHPSRPIYTSTDSSSSVQHTQTQQYSQQIQQTSTYPQIDTEQSKKIFNTLIDTSEVIQPFLDKYGRLVHSRTGEKVYVGSSSMTLFGLEIQSLIPENILKSQMAKSTTSMSTSDSPTTPDSTDPVLEREGDAYRIMLGKTRNRPGIAVNFTLPSYSYAMLLVDTFIGYNDGCFYFFNEGLVKENLKKVYEGSSISQQSDSILETIWFCKVLLIFAVGEMYLGTANNSNGNKNKLQSATLPGSGFFHQASELFTGIFASGAIDNCARDGGIEVMLLYAFYLQVADCTVASYFYFGLALRASLILGWHVDAGKENLSRYELEHRRRLWWTVYMYERMLSSKAGLPLSFTDDSISAELPVDFDMSSPPPGCEHYIFPEAEYITNCVRITQINAKILSKLYTKQPNSNILPVVADLVNKLLEWKQRLPPFLKVDYSAKHLSISRLVVNMNTEYFQGMNLAVRPLLFHFATQQLKQHMTDHKYIDLTKYSKSVLTLLNASFQASINTVRSLWVLMPQNMVALFGWMDREYLFTSASTLILFNAAFGVHDATKEHLDHALTIFTKMRNLGNHPAALRRAQLLKLISVLDFNGVMNSLLVKHDDHLVPTSIPFSPTSNQNIETPEEERGAPPSNNEKTSFSSIKSKFVSNNNHEVLTSRSTVSDVPLSTNSQHITNLHRGPTNPDHKHMMESSTRSTLPRNVVKDNHTQQQHEISLSPFLNPSFKINGVSPESLNLNVDNKNSEEQELWNEISNQAMWLGDVSEEFQSLMGDFM